MALVALPTEMWMPPAASGGVADGGGIRPGRVLDVEGDSFALIFQVGDKSDGKTINKIGVGVNTVTAAGNVDARLETVGPTTGDPTDTLANGSDSNKVQAVSSTGWNEFALTGGYTVSRSEVLAVRFVAAATTNITLREFRRLLSRGWSLPYITELISPSGSWVKTDLIIVQGQTIAVGYSDGTWEYIYGCQPIVTTGVDTIISSGVAEVGIEFQLPAALRLSSVIAQVDQDGDIAIHVGNGSYLPGDTGATRLSTTAFDKDIRSADFIRQPSFVLSTPVDLAANTTYRVLVDSTETTNVRVQHMTVDSNALLEACGVPISWRHIIDNGAGGWTTTDTKLAVMALGFSQIHDGAGGGLSFIETRRNTLIGR